MSTNNTKFQPLLLLVIDAVILCAAFTFAYILRVQLNDKPLSISVSALEFFYAFLVIIPIWLVIFASLGLYSAGVYNARLKEWSRLALGAFMGVLLVIGFEYFTSIRIFPAKLVVVYTLVFSFLLLVIERELFRFVRGLLYRYKIGVQRVLIIGNSAATADIALGLSDTKQSGYDIVAVACPKKDFPPDFTARYYVNAENALRNINDDNITTIIQTDLYDNEDRNRKVLESAQVNHIRYSFIPGEAEFYSGKNTVDVLLGYPMITVSQTPLIGWGEIVKRIFDLSLSLLGIVIFSPFLLLLFLAQKLFNPGPAFYISKRLSRFSEPVNLIKFRTMGNSYGSKDAAEEFREMGREDLAREYEKNRKVDNDPRITRFGKFLRSTSLDELPQIVNILKGDISLVGPRPILPQEMKLSRGRAALLHSVRSGMTGLWQVSGRSDLSFEKRIELELYYAQNWSFWLDIKILFKTVGVVLFRRGAK